MAVGLYSTSVDVSATSAFPGSAQVTLPWRPKSVALINEHPTAAIDVSLDGTTIHATLTGGTPGSGIVIHQPNEQIWAQCVAGGTSVILRVIAEDY